MAAQRTGLTQALDVIGHNLAIEELAARIPSSLVNRSGKVFYSGRNAFSSPSALYILGVNPGGAPDNHATETIESHTNLVLHAFSADWSAYRDESWEGAKPGTYGMAPRVLHLLKQLGLNPGAVPASNLVFPRSRREADITRNDMTAMANECWPFHESALELLRPRVILCFGQTAGTFVRRRLGANRVIGEFVEQNNRRWTSRAFAGSAGVNVVVATHPSIADWCAPSTDVSWLVEKALQ